MLVDADKVKEKLAKICERTKGLARDGWPEYYEAHEIAAAIRETDLADCVPQMDTGTDFDRSSVV